MDLEQLPGLGNLSYSELAKLKPFGWTLSDPPSVIPYNFECLNDGISIYEWSSNNVNLVFYVGAIYLVTIFGLQQWMKNRPAYDLKIPLFLWNLMLAIFSIMTFVRVIPGFWHVISQRDGFYNSICVKENLDIPFAFWGYMFAVSKFIELGDTVFIVLRKRPLVILQWYHHLVTMTVGWVTLPLVEPLQRWFVTLNSGVHSVMYPYFTLKSIGAYVPTSYANFLTTIQFVQMLIAFGVNIATFVMLYQGYPCARYPLSIKSWGLVFTSFIFLFGKLFYESVLGGKRHKKKTS